MIHGHRLFFKEANIGLAMLASLGITFPFKVPIGIGLYHYLIGVTAIPA